MRGPPSDDEEGFIPSFFQVKPPYVAIRSKSMINEQKKFIAHYRYTGETMKKEPPQSYLMNEQCLLYNVASQSKRVESDPTIFMHPYDYYNDQNLFTLVYSRDKENLRNNREYMKREIDLRDLQECSDKIRMVKQFTLPTQKNTLQFQSRFESGNLHSAYKCKGQEEYHLLMEHDTNTLGYSQWFYFAVINGRANVKYTFKITNFKKQLSAFKSGYQPAIFSLKQKQKRGNGWFRDGSNIQFTHSNIRPSPNGSFYTLSFDIRLKHSSDYVLVALSYPYSYTRLITGLREMEQEVKKQNSGVSLSLESVGKSICRNHVPQVTVANGSQDKPVIVVLARQHPGETWSSFMAEHIIQSLISENGLPLLHRFTFILYPMINVDGVIHGNFRCDLSGVDLNRRWKHPSATFHSQLCQIKKRVQTLAKKVHLVLDLHGHSKKYNVFCYACKQNQYTCRILPYIMAKETPLFHFPSCTFGLQRDKVTTARAVFSKMLHTQNVLTIETSFYGYTTAGKLIVFNPIHIALVAAAIVRALIRFTENDCNEVKYIEEQIKENYSDFIEYDQLNAEQSGSDSDPQADQIDFKVKLHTIFNKSCMGQAKSFTKESTKMQLHQNNIQFQLQVSKPIIPVEITVQHSDEDVIEHKINVDRRRKNKTKMNFIERKERKNASYIQKHSKIAMVAKDCYYRVEPQLRKYEVVHKIKKMTEKMSGRINNSPKQQIRKGLPRLEASKSIERESQSERQENVTIDSFMHKFGKFIPNYPSHHRTRMQNTEQQLSQNHPLAHIKELMRNKEALQRDQIKRKIEQSTLAVQRKGKIRSSTSRQEVIDFNKFKNRSKISTLRIKEQTVIQRYKKL